MLTVQIRPVAGRLSATPWGRHVNEGAFEYPVALLRLVRALIDTWRRRRPDWPEQRVLAFLAPLATHLPIYYLPPATTAHTRTYQHANTENPDTRNLILDAFVVLDPASLIEMHWPEVELTSDALTDLRTLLTRISYLGRSESWVELDAHEDEPSGSAPPCPPSESGMPYEERATEAVQVLCPTSPAIYDAEAVKSMIGKLRKTQTDVLWSSESWLEAMMWSSEDQRLARLSHLPATRTVSYRRPRSVFHVPAARSVPRSPDAAVLARFALATHDRGRTIVRPRITQTLPLAEGFRKRLLDDLEYKLDTLRNVWKGHDDDGTPLEDHQHLFVIPQDTDADGQIDEIAVYLPAGMKRDELSVLSRIQSFRWNYDQELRLVFLGAQPESTLLTARAGTPLVTRTPFVPPRYYKARRDGDGNAWWQRELRQALKEAMIDSPAVDAAKIEPLHRCEWVRGNPLRWAEFVRSRYTRDTSRERRRQAQPRWGFGARITLPIDVKLPLSIGYAAHFGLGQLTQETE